MVRQRNQEAQGEGSAEGQADLTTGSLPLT